MSNAFDLPPHLRNCYSYLVFKLVTVLSAFEPIDPEVKPDAYLSEDHETRALRTALAEGYRWVRTDRDFAIFEKTSLLVPRAVQQAFSRYREERTQSPCRNRHALSAVRPTSTLIQIQPTPARSSALSVVPPSPSKSDEAGAQLLELLRGVCGVHSLPEILRGLAELCDRDAEQFTRELDDSGIVESCRTDAAALRRLADEMGERHGE